MANIKDNISKKKLVAPKAAKVGIVRSEYNPKITEALLESCLKELKKSGISEERIFVVTVPGAWEIPIATQQLIKAKKPNVVITLGLILKGQTPHFDFIAMACAKGIMDVSLETGLPIIFGVLTTNTLAQAKARIKGGSHGDKGIEAAQAAIKMLNLN